MNSHKTNNTWEVAMLPPGRKTLPGHWVFQKKLCPTGEVVRYESH